MSFKTLLVHVEADPTPDPRLALAIDLANQFDAKLIGVGAEHYRAAYYGGYGIDYGAGYLIAEEMESDEADLKRAEEKFRGSAAAVREASDYNIAQPGALILQTGRPVLVTPPEAARLTVASVVVAWKDTREGRRAVTDALPFLQRAETIQLVEICENKAAAPATAARLADVANHLLRHGVKTTVNADIAERDAASAEQLLDIVERQKADLIVAGAYGHSRLQEWVFGGFTRALLAQTARAVLFSH
jgi:nucleotide-binding universal stress UspA family protein